MNMPTKFGSNWPTGFRDYQNAKDRAIEYNYYPSLTQQGTKRGAVSKYRFF
jgi:hypothetical protein